MRPGGPTGAASQPGFQAWLDLNDLYLPEFLAEVPDLADDPFNEDGLRLVERLALDAFATIDDALTPANAELFDKIVRFVGETFVVNLDGEWTDKLPVDDGRAHLAVRFSWSHVPLEIPPLVTAAVARRRGGEFAFVYRNLVEDMAQARG